ncbi:nischarin isoform X2 [Bacillus rossius redtenbacheri]|uniref:nischarin isoform X2 n=1 Tax=Bacillus rossius redtenbacheri TaxID=93214 RepID=UPI002FDEE6A5
MIFFICYKIWLYDSSMKVMHSFIFLHAISERLKQPCPPLEILDKRMDFSHVMDFCSHLTSVTISGSSASVGTSNIVPNKLPFELSVFRAIERLTFINVSLASVYSVGSTRDSVKCLAVHASGLKSIASVLLCDVIHKDVLYSGERHAWKKVSEADFSNNELEQIDEAVKLMPNMERLVLNNNRISTVDNLTLLPRLVHLGLSANSFSAVEELHTRLGHVVMLDLSQNSISSLRGFSKLYSLESLDVGCNRLDEVAEVRHLGGLPCLESLVLLGNPLAIVVDYRVRVLEYFGSRAAEICLDNDKPTQKELDTVAVLQALRIVKEGRTPMLGP